MEYKIFWNATFELKKKVEMAAQNQYHFRIMFVTHVDDLLWPAIMLATCHFFQKFVFLFCYSTIFCFATILMILFCTAFLQVNATWWGEQTVANHPNNGGLCVSVWAELQCTLYPTADGDFYLWLSFALPTRGQATIEGKHKAPTSPPLFLFLH